jgi:hypothetical protein
MGKASHDILLLLAPGQGLYDDQFLFTGEISLQVKLLFAIDKNPNVRSNVILFIDDSETNASELTVKVA